MSWASGWDKFFKKANNFGRKIDPLGHKLVDAVVKQDSKNVRGISREMAGWFGGDDTWLGSRFNDLGDEAEKNVADPVRAEGRAALTFGALYGAGATGLGGAGAGAGAGAEAGAATGLSEAGAASTTAGSGLGGASVSAGGYGSGTLGTGYLSGTGMLGSETVAGAGGGSSLAGAYGGGAGLAGSGAYGGAGGITSTGYGSGSQGFNWNKFSQQMGQNMQKTSNQMQADESQRARELAAALKKFREQQEQTAQPGWLNMSSDT